MTKHRVLALSLLLLVAATPALPNDVAPSEDLYDAEEAFEVLQGLEGEWSGEAVVVRPGQAIEEGVKSDATVEYKTIANGSSVIATFAESTPMEMVSVFHQDGKEKLIHTHYCAVGNQPSMKFEPSDKPGEIVFLFTSGTNMDVEKDGHVHHTRLQVIDKDTLETETDLWRDGKLSAVRHTKLKRVK